MSCKQTKTPSYLPRAPLPPFVMQMAARRHHGLRWLLLLPKFFRWPRSLLPALGRPARGIKVFARLPAPKKQELRDAAKRLYIRALEGIGKGLEMGASVPPLQRIFFQIRI